MYGQTKLLNLKKKIPKIRYNVTIALNLFVIKFSKAISMGT